jgi:hypothetical protein
MEEREAYIISAGHALLHGFTAHLPLPRYKYHGHGFAYLHPVHSSSLFLLFTLWSELKKHYLAVYE